MFTKTADSPIESLTMVKDGVTTVKVFCKKCGHLLTSTDKVCPQCQTPVEE
jgi:rubrerythrin